MLATALLVALTGTDAQAGGSWLDPVQDDTEAGDTVTLVGYVGRGQLGWLDAGPFYAYLRVESPPPAELENSGWPNVLDTDIPLGQLEIEDRGNLGYLSLRISITFEIPVDVPPGGYPLVYCNDPCTDGIGDLIGGLLYVGLDYGSLGCREWAFDEPEIANLPPDAELCGPGGSGTVAEIRAGTVTQGEDGWVDDGTGDEIPLTQPAELLDIRAALLDSIDSGVAARNNALAAEQVVVQRKHDGISPWVLAGVIVGFAAAGVVTAAAIRKPRDAAA